MQKLEQKLKETFTLILLKVLHNRRGIKRRQCAAASKISS